jgi:hypothetical protein
MKLRRLASREGFDSRPNPNNPAGGKFVGYFLTSGQSLASSGLAASSGGIVATSL